MTPNPPTTAEAIAEGRRARRTVSRGSLRELITTGRDPLGVLDDQNATRLPDLLPLRAERMSASPFAFYRGTAALMAADLAAGPSSGIQVASCGDAHVANFGFYASPQRTLVFDLNDFDEAAWAPWEWDLKRLVASMVIAGQATERDAAVIEDAATATVRAYTTALREVRAATPIARYYQHFDAEGGLNSSSKAARRVLRAAIKDAEKRTSDRAARKLIAPDAQGRLRFVETPPTMTHVDDELESTLTGGLAGYLQTTNADIRLLLRHYTVADTARRVVGVGSVGTRCFVTALVDGDGDTLLMQTKEAGRSVLAAYGGRAQPAEVDAYIAASGEGGRVVAMQRILQGVSDPFLGHFSGGGYDYYVRQFRDMKGGIDAEALDDASFRRYGQACATVLARAHSQSPTAAQVIGYIGGGTTVTEAIVEWSYGYAELSRTDYDAFVARGR